MFKDKIYSHRGVPVSKISLLVFFISVVILASIQYVAIFSSLSFSELFGFIGWDSEKVNTDEFSRNFQIYISGMVLSVGPTVWFVGHTSSLGIAKKLFHIQRFSLFHLIWSTKSIPINDIFLLKNQPKWYESAGLVFIGSWSLSILLAEILAPNLIFLTGGTSNNPWDIILLASAFTMASYIIVVPIVINFTSNIRMKLRSRNMITSAFSLYKYLILSFFSMNIILNTISGLNEVEPLAAINYVFFCSTIDQYFILFAFFA